MGMDLLGSEVGVGGGEDGEGGLIGKFAVIEWFSLSVV